MHVDLKLKDKANSKPTSIRHIYIPFEFKFDQIDPIAYKTSATNFTWGITFKDYDIKELKVYSLDPPMLEVKETEQIHKDLMSELAN